MPVLPPLDENAIQAILDKAKDFGHCHKSEDHKHRMCFSYTETVQLTWYDIEDALKVVDRGEDYVDLDFNDNTVRALREPDDRMIIASDEYTVYCNRCHQIFDVEYL